MQRLSVEQDRLRITSESPSGVGAFLLIVGILVSFGGVIALAGAEMRITTPLLAASTATIMGFIFILAYFSRRGMDFRWAVVVDRTGLHFEHDGRSVRFDVDRFRSLEVQHTSGGNRRRSMYALYLRRKDGSYFWIQTETRAEALEPWIDAIRQFLPLPVHYATPEPLALKGLEPIPPPNSALESAPDATTPVLFDSSLLHAKVRTVDGLEELSLQQPASWISRAIMILTALLFVGTPMAIGWQFFLDRASDPGTSWVSVFGVLPFILLFTLLALGMLTLSTRRYAVILRADQIRMKVRLAGDSLSRIIPRLFTRDRVISRDDIRSVRVDRLAEGNLRLAVVRKHRAGTASPLLDKILFQVSLFRPPPGGPGESDEVLGLWEIPGTNRRKDGPVMEDLLFLEKKIQDRLRLRD